MKSQFVGAALSAILAASPAALRAEPMTFDAALARASVEAPSLHAGEAALEGARASADAAGRLPDPMLSLSVENFPISGPPSFSLTRDEQTMLSVGIEQAFPNPAERRAQRTRAAADIMLAESELAVERQRVRLATALAWIDLYYARRRLAQLDLLGASLDGLQATVAARLASGAARPSQALEPEQLRAAVADRRIALVAEVARARAGLARTTRDADADIVGDPPALEMNAGALRAALETLPSPHAAEARAGVADANVAMARAETRPDWRVRTAYGRRDPAYGDMVSLELSVDLPLFRRHRQNARIAAAAREAERARFERSATIAEVAAALEGDLADHQMHLSQLDNARTALVPLARRRAEMDLASYSAGTIDLGEALLSSLALAEAEVDALSREATVASDAVRIIFTYGPVTNGQAINAETRP